MTQITEPAHLCPANVVPRYAVVATWLGPIFIISGFAFVAAAPVAVAIVGLFRAKSSTVIRILAAAWAAIYFVPFALYLAQDTYPSMAKMYSIWAHIGMATPGVVLGLLLLRDQR